MQNCLIFYANTCTKRMLDTKDTVDKVANQNEFLRRRVDELEFILHKSHKRNLVFDDLDKRLLALENRVHTFSIDISVPTCTSPPPTSFKNKINIFE